MDYYLFTDPKGIVIAKCLEKIGGTTISLVCGTNRSGMRMTEYD